MDKYREFVENLSANRISKEFLNSDQQHALEVFVSLFNMATSDVRIFAGSLCENNTPEYVANNPRYIEALSNFIERGGNVRILLNHYDIDKAISSDLMRRLAYYATSEQYSNQIQLRSTDTKFHFASDTEKKEVHFTIVDKIAYRVETNIEARTATCNFNNESFAEILINSFDPAFQDGTAINIADIFSTKN